MSVRSSAVLSKSAVALLQVSLALQSWLRARLTVEPDQQQTKLWDERGADGWLRKEQLQSRRRQQ